MLSRARRVLAGRVHFRVRVGQSGGRERRPGRPMLLLLRSPRLHNHGRQLRDRRGYLRQRHPRATRRGEERRVGDCRIRDLRPRLRQRREGVVLHALRLQQRIRYGRQTDAGLPSWEPLSLRQRQQHVRVHRERQVLSFDRRKHPGFGSGEHADRYAHLGRKNLGARCGHGHVDGERAGRRQEQCQGLCHYLGPHRNAHVRQLGAPHRMPYHRTGQGVRRRTALFDERRVCDEHRQLETGERHADVPSTLRPPSADGVWP
mmetsp:Transcript_20990/g.47343  ORF Transcript_20990/g.47343 Transcript_20990/m.47343 type:complete len:260 (-) Transcript_20990:2098-2877(-)